MRLFVDSSALAKRYVLEPGSEQVIELLGKADEVVLSVVSAVELISAFTRRKREGTMSLAAYKKLKKAFANDLETVSIVELFPTVVSLAVQCLERSSLRSLDAIQVASAIICECDLFLSGDERQAECAKSEGLQIVTC